MKLTYLVESVYLPLYGSPMEPTYSSAATREKKFWERIVAYAIIIGAVVQFATLWFLYRTIVESQSTTAILNQSLMESKESNDILNKTLGEYRDSNKLLDKTLTAAHVPMLSIRITSVKKIDYGISFSYILKNEGDSLANNIVAKWEINDVFSREFDLTEHIKYDSTEYYFGESYAADYSSRYNLMPISQILCLLPKKEQAFKEARPDASDNRVYKAILANTANLKGTFTYEDMFHHQYQTIVRVKYYDKQFPVIDMELSGYYLELQK